MKKSNKMVTCSLYTTISRTRFIFTIIMDHLHCFCSLHHKKTIISSTGSTSLKNDQIVHKFNVFILKSGLTARTVHRKLSPTDWLFFKAFLWLDNHTLMFYARVLVLCQLVRLISKFKHIHVIKSYLSTINRYFKLNTLTR